MREWGWCDVRLQQRVGRRAGAGKWRREGREDTWWCLGARGKKKKVTGEQREEKEGLRKTGGWCMGTGRVRLAVW